MAEGVRGWRGALTNNVVNRIPRSAFQPLHEELLRGLCEKPNKKAKEPLQPWHVFPKDLLG